MSKSNLKVIPSTLSSEERLRLWNEKRRQNMSLARAARWKERSTKVTSTNPAILEKAERLRPELIKRAALGDVSGMLNLFGPVAIMVLADLAVHGKDEKTRKECSRELAYMAGWKPVERSMNVEARLNSMTEKELMVLIRSELGKMPAEERKKLFPDMS